MLVTHIVAEVLPAERLITEGLVKVPPDLLRMVLDIIAEQMFWMLRDKPEMKTRYRQHYAAVLAEAKTWGITLPRAKFKPPGEDQKRMMIVHRRLDLSGLPSQYGKLQSDRENLLIVLDYNEPQGKSVANYRNRTRESGVKDAIIVVHMLAIRGVADFPARRSPDEVPHIMAYLSGFIRHELQHLVQHVVLAPVAKQQIATRPEYRAHKTDYYASQVERDPQIADAVDNFIEFWTMLNQPGVSRRPTLARAIKQFIGAIPSAGINSFDAEPVFKALKQVDPDGYRRAVRKFLPALSAALAGLNRGSPRDL